MLLGVALVCGCGVPKTKGYTQTAMEEIENYLSTEA